MCDCVGGCVCVMEVEEMPLRECVTVWVGVCVCNGGGGDATA